MDSTPNLGVFFDFLGLSIFLQFLKMAPAPNFGVFLDFARPFLTEVDFSNH